MSLLTTINNRDNTNSEENYIYYYGSGVKNIFVINVFGDLKPSELIEAASRNCGRRSRISPRAIASANGVAVSEVEAAHLALMDISTVVPAWGRGSKCLNFPLLPFSVEGEDAHRVTSLYFFDFLPSNFMTAQRIDNDQPLIKEDYRGLEEDLIHDGRSEQAPNDGDETGRKSVIKDIYVSQAAEKEEAQKGKNIGTSRAEELPIGHGGIFSCTREMWAA